MYKIMRMLVSMSVGVCLAIVLAATSGFFSPVMAGSVVQNAAMAQLLATKSCPQCDLRGVDLSGQNLRGADLSGANLSSANLRDANLRGANLQGAKLQQVVLEDTLLAGANLRDADLSDMDVDEVFESIEIIGTQFEGARFKYGVVCGPSPTKGGWGCQQL